MFDSMNKIGFQATLRLSSGGKRDLHIGQVGFGLQKTTEKFRNRICTARFTRKTYGTHKSSRDQLMMTKAGGTVIHVLLLGSADKLSTRLVKKK